MALKETGLTLAGVRIALSYSSKALRRLRSTQTKCAPLEHSEFVPYWQENYSFRSQKWWVLGARSNYGDKFPSSMRIFGVAGGRRGQEGAGGRRRGQGQEAGGRRQEAGRSPLHASVSWGLYEPSSQPKVDSSSNWDTLIGRVWECK